MNNLINYYSYEGNCEEISKAIESVIDVDILRLVPKKRKENKKFI